MSVASSRSSGSGACQGALGYEDWIILSQAIRWLDDAAESNDRVLVESDVALGQAIRVLTPVAKSHGHLRPKRFR